MDNKQLLKLTSSKVCFGALNNAFLNSLDWQEEHAQSSIEYNFFLNKNVIPQTNPSFNLVEHFDPMRLNTKLITNMYQHGTKQQQELITVDFGK